MKFLVYLHRSIVDRAFFRDVLEFKARTAVLFFFQLVLLATAFETISHMLAVFDSSTGLPAIVSHILPGMAIRDGQLDPAEQSPFVPSPVYVGRALMIMDNRTMPGFELPDSVIVVDTARHEPPSEDSPIRLLLGKRYAFVNLLPGIAFRVPYTSVVPHGQLLEFTEKGVAAFLKERAFGLGANIFLRHFVVLAISMLFIVFFLSFAAYIFNVRKKLGYRQYVRMATYAISPLAIGVCLTALADTRTSWVWHLTVFLSTMVMFRSTRFALRDSDDTQPNSSDQE